MELKDKSSIMKSLFKRKGEEGTFTKVIERDNENFYEKIYNKELKNNEKGVIICFFNENNWFLLTNLGIHINNEISVFLAYSDIKEVRLAIEKEFENNITDKNFYSNLLLIDNNNKEYVLNIESGKPFWGIYQVLHFI